MILLLQQIVENDTRGLTVESDSFNIILLVILGTVGGFLLLITIALFIVAVAMIRKKNYNDVVVGKGRKCGYTQTLP